MNDSALHRLVAKQQPAPRGHDDELADDLGVFGWLRGVRDRAVMLELRRKNRSITALSYVLLERAEFDPSNGITLKFGGTTVRITGRNLNRQPAPHVRLFDGLVRHRVPWLQESSGAGLMEAGRDATVIERVEIE
jgi:hypothetical protein